MSSSEGAHAAPHNPSIRTSRTTSSDREQDYAVRLGMWLFLGTEVLLFAGLFLGYSVYRHFYYEAFQEASRHLDLSAGTTNTMVPHQRQLEGRARLPRHQAGQNQALRRAC